MASCFHPTHRAHTLSQINLDFLWDIGIRVIMIDMDNTVISWRLGHLIPGAQEFVQQAKDKGFRLVIVSNNTHKKSRACADMLSIAEIVPNAKKPSKGAFLRVAKHMGVDIKACAAIGDQLVTDIIGANRAGVGASILVNPHTRNEAIYTRCNRVIERLIFFFTKQKGHKKV